MVALKILNAKSKDKKSANEEREKEGTSYVCKLGNYYTQRYVLQLSYYKIFPSSSRTHTARYC